jgi:two-component system, OmpR family, sensor histidine kinase KdpD
MEHQRPSPDVLLAQIQDADRQGARGKLKIFLGYAAGVGKTYAMLEAAHQRLAEGVDVVAGYVETHGRAETEALLPGLEVIPRREVEYRGAALTEMDVDAILERRPRLALVDELAHSNVPGSRHSKRYLDVEELLAAGIDVYTTLNIQHLESLNDAVAQITGVVVRERVPDTFIDNADEIELADLPPQELLVRLREGKVYVPDQAARAVHRFFRLGNLTALREMALRRAAERVDDQMRTYMQARAIPGPWPAGERLLVCISPGLVSERLIHAARRLAGDLDAEWFAVYVEAAGHIHPSASERDAVARNLQLAEELGAKAISLPGRSVADSVLTYARQHNITKIIAGKPLRPRWMDLLRGSVVDQIIRGSGEIDVYVITSQSPVQRGVRVSLPARGARWWNHLLAVALVAGMTALGAFIGGVVQPVNLVMLYLAAVVIAAVYLGRGPSILAAVLSVLAFDFFFVPPRLTFVVSDTQYGLTFAGLLVVGLVISSLTSQARDQAEAAQQRETQAVQLYEFSRDLSLAREQDAILETIIAHVSQTFSRDAAILLPHAEQGLALGVASSGLTLDANELAVAEWVFRHDQPAGRGTNTLPAAKIRYSALRTPRGVVGVLGVMPTDPSSQLTQEQRRLLEVFASQAALAIERAQLAERARQVQLLEATEKLQTALLNSISHDLRTPLVTITGAFSNLESAGDRLDEATRCALARAGREEAERLNQLVGNLLDITRIEAGALRLTEEPCDVAEAVGVVLDRLSERLDGRPVAMLIPQELPPVPMDMALMVQALVNVVDNAAKYSSPGSPIDISARQVDDQIEIEVADRGAGIALEDLPHIFDKFYRVQRPDGRKGTGLGLSISKGIIEAHGGKIRATNRSSGGAVVSITLPLAGTPMSDRGNP